MRKLCGPILALLAIGGLVGCGGSSGGTILGASNPRIQVVNAINTPATAKIVIDSQVLTNGVPFDNAINYMIFNEGNLEVQFEDPTSSGPLVMQNELFQLNSYYTVVAYNDNASPTNYHMITLVDDPSSVANMGQLRIANVAALLPSVDVYVTAPGAKIGSVVPTVSAVAYGDATQAYFPEPPATYQVTVTTAGTKTVVAGQLVTVSGTQVNNVIIMEDSGGNIKILAANPH